MSDDTPTQRFEPEGSDTPTQRFETPTGAGASEEVVEERKSRKLMIILGSIGGALLLAVIILLIFLLVKPFGGGGSPTGSPTPTRSGSASPTATQSSTPTPTPTPTPTQTTAPPPDTSTTINAFDGQDSISCNNSAPVEPDYTLYFEWSTSNATQVFFGVGTTDAEAGPLYPNLPASGNSQNDFPGAVAFPCYAESQIFTLTAIGTNGQKVSETITVVNDGDTSP